MTGNASHVAGHGSQDITLVLATITFEFTAHSRTGIQEPANAAYGDAVTLASILNHHQAGLVHKH